MDLSLLWDLPCCQHGISEIYGKSHPGETIPWCPMATAAFIHAQPRQPPSYAQHLFDDDDDTLAPHLWRHDRNLEHQPNPNSNSDIFIQTLATEEKITMKVISPTYLLVHLKGIICLLLPCSVLWDILICPYAVWVFYSKKRFKLYHRCSFSLTRFPVE